MLSRNIRLLSKCIIRKSITPNILPKRNAGFGKYWVYRQEPVRPEEWRFYTADVINTFMWWWVFIHCWYQWGHIVGEFDYPEPKKWSDAELGVVSEEEL